VSGTNDVEVVQADARDVDFLVPLFEAYRAFYRQPPDPEGTRTFLRERLERAESVIFLAALEPDGGGRDAVGFTQLYPLFSSAAMKRLWLLNDLYVVPTARRNRVAQRLMMRAEQHARETGASGLMLQTAVDNFSAQRLYESVGYERDTNFYVYNRNF
jgi:ribosomal protein S18 acetylase RimI-like enzyme